MATATTAGGLLGWLKVEEGLRLRPYRCPAGFLTIGYGLNLDAGITTVEAEWLLAHRVRHVECAVAGALSWWSRLDEVRRGVLVALAYQAGVEGLLKFRATLAAVERGDYDTAARQMLRSKWATQTPARAARTAEAMRTGRWPAGV